MSDDDTDDDMIIQEQIEEVQTIASGQISESEDGIDDPGTVVCRAYLNALIDRFSLGWIEGSLKEIKSTIQNN